MVEFHYAAPAVGAKSGRNKRGGGAKKAAAQKGGSRRGGKTSQRVGLILFAVVFVALFVIFAVAQGIGAPSVPSGDIALVTNVPAEVGHISEADYKRTLARQEKQAGLKKPPKAGSKKAEELHQAAVGELIGKAWIIGEGEELGFEVTPKEIETELNKVKKESFGGSEKKYEEFLKEQEFTEEDVEEILELNILQTKIKEKIPKEAPPVSESQEKEYYEAEKQAQYTKKPTRDVRVLVNENKKEVEAARKALEADNSEGSWKKVTKKYSPTTAANAGLQKEIAEEFLTEPLKKDIFGAATGELIGPIKQEKSWLLLEVVKLHPEKTQPFSEVKATIASTLTQEAESKYFENWVKQTYEPTWRSRTICASGFMIESCSNYKGNGHPAGNAESCYEAEPKKAPTECQAPVLQNAPAVPGSISQAKPEGERLVQRPLPPAEPKKAKGSKAAEGTAGAGAPSEEEAAVKAAEEAAAKAAAESAAKSEEK